MEALTELTVAVGDVTHAVQALRSDVCARFPRFDESVDFR